MKIIYIAGDGRSGSTLLDSILNNVDSSVSVGECHRFWLRYYEGQSLCGCGQLITNCELWNNIHNKITEKYPNYDPQRFLKQVREIQIYKNFYDIPRLLKEPDWVLFSAIVKDYYRLIAASTGSKVIIDSSKSIAWAYVIQSLNFSDLRIVHLERSLIAVANSWKKDMQLPEYINEVRMMPKKSDWVIIKNWLKIKYTAKRIQSDTNYLYLSYESFCHQPIIWLKELSRFLEVHLPENDLKSLPNHAIGGNPMRAGLQNTIEIKKPSTNFNNLSTLELFLFKRIQFAARWI